jgi:hypothetical protein
VTIEEVRETIKVHVQAAESCGNQDGAMSLAKLLTAIDEQLLEDGFFDPPPP